MQYNSVFYMILVNSGLDILTLGIIGLILGLARGAFSSVNGNVSARMVRHGVLGFTATLLFGFALAIDAAPNNITGEITRAIPFSQVGRFGIALVIGLWADDLLKATVLAADGIINIVKNRIVKKFFPAIN